MDIILLQKVANLGQIGDRVKVKSGYARNFLVPTGKATVATAANIAQVRGAARRPRSQGQRGTQAGTGARAEFRELQTRNQGQSRHRRQTVRIDRHVGHRRSLGQGGTADRTFSEVRMPTGPIRSTGEHQVQLHLHTDVNVTLNVTIVAEE
jgi:large subunit ribosomal protein L9